MDGNDLGMIARVFMFLLKGLKYVLKLVWFTGLWWFCVPLVVGIGYEEITVPFPARFSSWVKPPPTTGNSN